MRILIPMISLFLLVACKSNTEKVPTPTSSPTIEEKVGIYKSATVYAASTDYEFEIAGKAMLVRVSTVDSLNLPDIPSNLTILSQEGPRGVNPILIGKKYALEFGPQKQLKSIRLLGAHDPSDPELPAIPENYSGLLSVAPSADSRAYLSLQADLSAILLINYEPGEQPSYQFGRWTRTDNGQKISVQLAEENWQFLVKEDALVLSSQQMGTGGLSLIATEDLTICHYVHQWLSDLSTTDGEQRVKPANISNEMPLADILRTEHAYMALYGELEEVYKADEATINQTLRANPTVQGVCDIATQSTGAGH